MKTIKEIQKTNYLELKPETIVKIWNIIKPLVLQNNKLKKENKELKEENAKLLEDLKHAQYYY